MEAPKTNFRFFKAVKNEPRRFHINPRTYNPEEEEWEKRVRRIEREVAIEKGEHVEHEPGLYDFRTSWARDAARTSRRKTANFLLIFILAGVIFGAYYLLQWLEQFE